MRLLGVSPSLTSLMFVILRLSVLPALLFFFFLSDFLRKKIPVLILLCL